MLLKISILNYTIPLKTFIHFFRKPWINQSSVIVCVTKVKMFKITVILLNNLRDKCLTIYHLDKKNRIIFQMSYEIFKRKKVAKNKPFNYYKIKIKKHSENT